MIMIDKKDVPIRNYLTFGIAFSKIEQCMGLIK